jgi:hypothetical protein
LLSSTIKIKKCGTGILHFVLYECETWSFILSKTHRLRAFENRMLRRIF